MLESLWPYVFSFFSIVERVDLAEHYPHIVELSFCYNTVDFMFKSSYTELRRSDADSSWESKLNAQSITKLIRYWKKGKNLNIFKWMRSAKIEGLAEWEEVGGNDLWSDRHLKHFSNVKSIKLCSLQNLTHSGLVHFKYVEKICLQDLNVSDRGLAHLKNVKNVKLVSLENIRDDGLSYLKNAEILELDNLDSISDDGLAHLTNVETITLSDLHHNLVTDDGLAHLKNVKIITLKRLDGVSDNGLAHLKNVESVSLRYLSNVSDNGLAHLKNVKNMELNNLNVSDNGLEHLKNVKGIKLIRIKMSDEGLAHLKNAKVYLGEGIEIYTKKTIQFKQGDLFPWPF